MFIYLLFSNEILLEFSFIFQQMKSKVAADAVRKMNPQMNIHAYIEGVLTETEHIYDDKFFERLNGVVNALDNVKARKSFICSIFHSHFCVLIVFIDLVYNS